MCCVVLESSIRTKQKTSLPEICRPESLYRYILKIKIHNYVRCTCTSNVLSDYVNILRNFVLQLFTSNETDFSVLHSCIMPVDPKNRVFNVARLKSEEFLYFKEEF